jgi:hypothetical protein
MMKTEQSSNYKLKPPLDQSTKLSNESLIDSERQRWNCYLDYSNTHSDRIRMSLTEYVHNLVHDQNRSICHLTITYKPYQDRIYTQKDVDQFFTNFYLKYLLPSLFGTKNFHRPSKRSIQPITLVFADKHLQSFHADQLHHHAILCVHPDTLNFFQNLPNENPIPNNLMHTKKICTSHIRECEPMTLLYATKMLNRYPDYLSFPDRFPDELH